MDSVGERIKAAREMKGLTVRRLSELTKLPIEEISDLESNRRVLSVSAMIQISRTFECSVDWLVTGSTFGAPKVKHIPSRDDGSLSQLESELVAMFRLLQEQERKNVFDFVTLLYEQKAEVADSAYLTYPNK